MVGAILGPTRQHELCPYMIASCLRVAAQSDVLLGPIGQFNCLNRDHSFTMETLYKQLKQLMRTCPLEGRLAKFIPADELDKITLAHIQAGLPRRRRFFSSCISDKVAAEAKRTFCVLVLMEESAAMEQLINEGITDEDLPLCRNGDDSDDSEYNVLASMGGNKRFPSSMSWGEGDKVDNFLKKQWVVQAPIFDKPGLHFVLEPECALPLTECETKLAKGGMGVVHKAKLHPAHQHLFPVCRATGVKKSTDLSPGRCRGLRRYQGVPQERALHQREEQPRHHPTTTERALDPSVSFLRKGFYLLPSVSLGEWRHAERFLGRPGRQPEDTRSHPMGPWANTRSGRWPSCTSQPQHPPRRHQTTKHPCF